MIKIDFLTHKIQDVDTRMYLFKFLDGATCVYMYDKTTNIISPPPYKYTTAAMADIKASWTKSVILFYYTCH